MNLHLSASIEAVSKVGKHTILHRFDLYQTPTKVTEELLKSDDVKSAYAEWSKQFDSEEMVNEYADDDVFQEREPVRTVSYSAYRVHVAQLEAWLLEHKDWNVEWYSM